MFRHLTMFTLIVQLLICVCFTQGETTAEAFLPPYDLDLWLSWLSSQKVCFSDLGCFGLQDPWFSWIRPFPLLPQPPEVVDTTFYLLTRRNVMFPQRLQTRPLVDLSGSLFDKKKQVVFIVHGYIGHYYDKWVIDAAQALLTLFDANIILVDWSSGSNMINYIQAVANARLVGMEIARLIRALTNQELSATCDINGLGFSLGAQVLAYAANGSSLIQRITGLDPAQPGFEGDPLVRLDSSDAPFIDVIHTNGAPFGFGVRHSVGHVDYFVNGGERQPECLEYSSVSEASAVYKREVYQRVSNYLENYWDKNERVDSVQQLQQLAQQQNELDLPTPSRNPLVDLLSGALINVIKQLGCSHGKAPLYYIESLQFQNCSFWGTPWSHPDAPVTEDYCTVSNCSEMGLHSILYPARGNFHVLTDTHPPYCRKMPYTEAVMKNGLADEFLRNSQERECLQT